MPNQRRSAFAAAILGLALAVGGCAGDAVLAGPEPSLAPAVRLSASQTPGTLRLCRWEAPPGAPRPLFVVDGVRRTLPPEELDRLAPRIHSVEILKGPAAVERYGPDARNGVVVIQTKRPAPRDR